LPHLQIPLVLPEYKVDPNHLGNLSIIGFTLFAIVFVTATGFGYWTWKHRNKTIVRMAQPGFLVMVVMASLVMGSTIVPLSFDDSRESYSESRGRVICMSTPWLAFLGFTITFSALLAKTWRVNQLFRNSGSFSVCRSRPLNWRRHFFFVCSEHTPSIPWNMFASMEKELTHGIVFW
jgi:gamma-aminobutyric acid type B receptor